MTAIKTLQTLFSVKINNNYYCNPEDNSDFEIIPTKQTKNIFDRFKLKWFKKKNNEYNLFFQNNSETFINHLKKNISYLNFEIYCNKNDFYNYSDVEVGKVYNFSNENKYPFLNKEEFVSDKDEITLKDYQHKLFGIVRISLEKIEKENEFLINLNALSSFWTYYIYNKNFKIKNILKIMSSDNNFVFLKHRENDNDFIYRSKKTIMLRDKYNFSILLQYENVEGKSIDEILPLPSAYTNYVSEKTYFSDIEYTVI